MWNMSRIVVSGKGKGSGHFNLTLIKKLCSKSLHTFWREELFGWSICMRQIELMGENNNNFAFHVTLILDLETNWAREKKYWQVTLDKQTDWSNIIIVSSLSWPVIKDKGIRRLWDFNIKYPLFYSICCFDL